MAQIWLGRTLNEADEDQTVEYQPGNLPKFNYKKSHSFYCLSSDMDDTEAQILANANCPALGSTTELGYPIKSRKAIEVDRIARHPVTGGPCVLWRVEVSADSSLSFAFPGGEIVLPEARRPVIKWTTNEEEIDFDYDVRTGQPVANVNGEPIFDTRKIIYPVLNYTRYESYYLNVPSLQNTYANTLNSVIFLGFPIESCLMLPLEIEEEEFELEEEGELATVTYNKVTYRIECKVGDYYANSRPFNPRYLNEGYYYRKAAGQKPVINAPDGNKTRVNLKVDGTILPDGDPYVWLEFYKYKAADWTALNIVMPEI
jgi:hypothetical protein